MVLEDTTLRTPVPASALSHLTPENRACIDRLAGTPSAPPLTDVPCRAQAAVAILLFESSVPLPTSSYATSKSAFADGPPQFHVLMTTRALHLRSHPGQASLPGGKVDWDDKGVEQTALRESAEEVGLPEHLGDEVVWIHTMPPYISKTCLLVTPVIFLLPNPTRTIPRLIPSPSEVSAIWSHPLRTLLSSTGPSSIPLADPSLIDKHRPPQHAWRTYSDVPWLDGTHYRLHRFRASHQLIKGLTADVLIGAAARTYGRAPAFRDRAPDQPPWDQLVTYVVGRVKDGLRGEKRWGDGESGDAAYTATDYLTIEGTDDADEDVAPEDGTDAGLQGAMGG